MRARVWAGCGPYGERGGSTSLFSFLGIVSPMGLRASVPSSHAQCLHRPGDAGQEVDRREGGEVPKGTPLYSPSLGPGNRTVPCCVTPMPVLLRQSPREESPFLSLPSIIQSDPNLTKYVPSHLHLDCQLPAPG